MQEMKIKVQTLEDAGHDRKNSAFPEVKDEDVIRGDVTIAIMEDMMESRKCAVDIMIELPDGKKAMAMVSEGLFDSLISVYNGTKERFAELQEKRGYTPW